MLRNLEYPWTLGLAAGMPPAVLASAGVALPWLLLPVACNCVEVCWEVGNDIVMVKLRTQEFLF